MSGHSQTRFTLIGFMFVGVYGLIAYQASAAPADLTSFGTFSLRLNIMKKITIQDTSGALSLNILYGDGSTTTTPDNPLDSASAAALRAYLQSVWLEFPHKPNYPTVDTSSTEYFMNPAFVNITICENTMRGGVSGVDVVEMKDGYLGAVTSASAALTCP
jgi:hypothetical protein